MEHRFIDLAGEASVTEILLFERDNNLDKRDNLHELPQEAAVYAICGRVNGRTANCRFVGVANDLQVAIRNHFGNDEPDECLREFMQSIKTKVLLYQAIKPSDVSKIEDLWRSRFKPECNKELNKVY